MKIPEKLTVEEVQKAIKIPAKKWHGRCYEIACAIVSAKLVKGRAVYGHYLGPVAKTGYWAERRGQGFQRHGWILLSDGRVLDPTRWSFEDKEPYLALVERSTLRDYDEGGNAFRAAMMGPPPAFQKTEKGMDVYAKRRLKIIKLKIGVLARQEIMRLLNHPPATTWQMVHWVANLPPATLGPAAPEVFRAIVKAGLSTSIPYDNRVAVLGDK
jgi:hypothetical protein